MSNCRRVQLSNERTSCLYLEIQPDVYLDEALIERPTLGILTSFFPWLLTRCSTVFSSKSCTEEEIDGTKEITKQGKNEQDYR